MATKAEELQKRTTSYALRILKLFRSLPNCPEARIIGQQLLRSGTSVAANYRAACRARSRAEFLSKLGIVEEEADESGFWMELIIDSGMKPARLIRPLYSEADELVRIVVSSIRTARSSRSQFRNPQSAIRNP